MQQNEDLFLTEDLLNKHLVYREWIEFILRHGFDKLNFANVSIIRDHLGYFTDLKKFFIDGEEEYDVKGVLRKYEYEDEGERIIHLFNEKGFLLKRIFVESNTQRKYVYDDRDNMLQRIYNNGGTNYYEYDANDNMIKETFFNGAVYSYEFDKQGHMIKEKTPTQGIHNYEYGFDGNLIKRVSLHNSCTFICNYEYDYSMNSKGNLVKETKCDGTVKEWKYFYNEKKILVKILENEKNIFQINVN